MVHRCGTPRSVFTRQWGIFDALLARANSAMNTNRLGQSSLEKTRSAATSLEIASNLLQFAEHFGVTRDSDFAQRTCAIAFCNGVILSKSAPEDAAKLLQICAPTLAGEELCRNTAQALASEVSDDEAWVTSLARNLWRRISQATNMSTRSEERQNLITAISMGLEAGTRQAGLTELISRRASNLGDESRFLAWLLFNWARNDFRPFAEPFVEYVLAYYVSLPIERRVVSVEVRETLVCSNLLADPWRLSFWVEQAWTRGRRFVEKHPDVLKQLLIESPQRNREYTLMLYRTLVLDAKEPTGRVDIERATLAFFSLTEDGGCAAEYCAGRQPRKLTRLAFDFAFWMGIVSAIALPLRINNPSDHP